MHIDYRISDVFMHMWLPHCVSLAIGGEIRGTDHPFRPADLRHFLLTGEVVPLLCCTAALLAEQRVRAWAANFSPSAVNKRQLFIRFFELVPREMAISIESTDLKIPGYPNLFEVFARQIHECICKATYFF